MSAIQRDLYLYGNSKLEQIISLSDRDKAPIDTSAYGAKMEIRNQLNAVILSATDVNSRIVVGEGTNSNEIRLILDYSVINAVLSELNAATSLVYDLVIYPTSASPTVLPVILLEGCIIWSSGVTELA